MINIVIFDTETTGLNFDEDQIIELSMKQIYVKDADVKSTSILDMLKYPVTMKKIIQFKPTTAIRPEATKIHGITNEDLQNEKPFSFYAEKIHNLFENANVLVAYNMRFDTEMLQSEFKRSGLPPLKIYEKIQLDPLLMWNKLETRKLSDAHLKFVGKELLEAHSASADTEAAWNILVGMTEFFNHSNDTIDELSAICNPHREKYIGPSYHIRWKNGYPIIAFGKHNGKSLYNVDPSYYAWALGPTNNQPFPPHVREIFKKTLTMDAADLVDWIISRYGYEKITEEDFDNIKL